MTPDRLRVVVADDHPAVVAAVCAALEARGMSVVARVADGDAALAAIDSEQPVVALVDLTMPGMSAGCAPDTAARILL